MYEFDNQLFMTILLQVPMRSVGQSNMALAVGE